MLTDAVGQGGRQSTARCRYTFPTPARWPLGRAGPQPAAGPDRPSGLAPAVSDPKSGSSPRSGPRWATVSSACWRSNTPHTKADTSTVWTSPGLQNDADAVAGAAGPVGGRGTRQPAVQYFRCKSVLALTEPDEQVLAAADEPRPNLLSGQVNSGVARNANIAAGQRFSHQRLAQDGGGVPHGVTFPAIARRSSSAGGGEADRRSPWGSRNPATSRPAPSFDYEGLIAVLEIATADAVEPWRRGQQHRRRRALLDGLDRMKRYGRRRRLGVDVASQPGKWRRASGSLR